MEINNELKTHLKQYSENSIKHCGATGVIVFIRGDDVYVGNVGDSRAVLYSGNKVTRLSFDHKPKDEDERVRKLDGHVINGRINGLLAVSRAFGDFYMQPWVSSEPYVSTSKLSNQPDEFIIIGCDGVWDEITDEEACEIIQTSLKNGGDVYKSSAVLRDYAYLLGSDDNVSVILIKGATESIETENES